MRKDIVIKSKGFFQQKLYREVILGLVISVIITIVIMILLTNISNRLNIANKPMSDEWLVEKFEQEYEKRLNAILNTKGDKLSIHGSLDSLLKEKFPLTETYAINSYRELTIAIVNVQGRVIHSNRAVIIVQEDSISDYSGNEGIQFIIDSESGEYIQTLMFSPKESIEIYDNTKQNYKLQMIRPINDQYYFIVYIKNYGSESLNVLLITILIFLLIFLLFSKGRLKYISLIEEAPSKILKSNYQYKLPIRYNNELTRVAKAMNQFVSELRMVEEREQEFLMGISHDLRTPLNSIVGYTQMIIEKKYHNEEEFEQYLKRIESKSKYMQKMIHDFFELVYIQGNQYKMQMVNIDMKEFLRQMVGDYIPILMNRGIEIELLFECDTCEVLCDTTLMHRVFDNIFNNVKKHGKKNSICIAKITKSGEVIISNELNKLYDEKSLTHLFDSYFKGEDSRAGDGLGIGLKLVQEIMEKHGGIAKISQIDNRFYLCIQLPNFKH